MSDYIPFDIQVKILQNLPVKSLIKFRKVCKEWKACIDMISFQKTYGVRTSQSCSMILRYGVFPVATFMWAIDNILDKTEIVTAVNQFNLTPVGTSEGIWCFSYGNPVLGCAIWNPSIKRSINVAVPYFPNAPKNDKILVGFGVRPDTLDPTIIKVSYPREFNGSWQVYVFTLGSMRWTQVKDGLPWESIRFKRRSQTVVGRLIMWAGHETIFDDDGELLAKEHLLVSFDMIDHSFQTHRIGCVFNDGLTIPMCLSNIGNCVIVTGWKEDGDSWLFCGWSLYVSETTISSFSLVFAIATPNALRLVGFTNDEIPLPIVETAGPNQATNILQVFNSTTHSFQDVGSEGLPGSFFIGTYKDSLILLPYPDHAMFHIPIA